MTVTGPTFIALQVRDLDRAADYGSGTAAAYSSRSA